MAGGFQDVILNPGVVSVLTFSQNVAGVAASNLIRYKEGQIQKLGGWNNNYYPFALSSMPIRDLHAFEGYAETKYVGYGSASKLGILQGYGSGGSSLVHDFDITPQAFRSTVTPNFSVTAGSNICTIIDPGSSMSQWGSIRLDTPISIGGIVLSGPYKIANVIDSNTYTILSSVPFIQTAANGGILPTFYMSSGSNSIDVLFPNNNYISQFGLFYPFGSSFCPTPLPATGATQVVIQGGYQVNAVLDSTHFQIGVPYGSTVGILPANAVPMNGGKASIYHYVVGGPPSVVGLYNVGLYGQGLYGIGTPAGAGGAAPNITAADWTLDNWGEGYLTACLKDDAIYYWGPTSGVGNAQPMVLNNAPPYNRGAFVGLPLQIMFAWGSCQVTNVQDLLQIRWSDTGAQAGFNEWRATPSTFAGGFKMANGSKLRCGLQAPLYAVFWTDVDCWIAQFVGQPIVFSFQSAGYGCGAVGPHCAGVSQGVVYWCSQFNFFALGPNGVQVLPCPIWDFFFQQLDQTPGVIEKVRCAVNSAYNEVTWHFPIKGLPMSGTPANENAAYVKLHIGEGQEYEWDYGYAKGVNSWLPSDFARTAWTDVSAVALPLGTTWDGSGNSYLMLHESTNDAANTAMNAAFETGYFVIGDATQFAFVDWVLPDAKWSMLGGTPGVLLFTFFTSDYTGQPERTYGPYPVTQGFPGINCRMRGRYWRMRVESQDVGTFWRLGRVKFRWAPSGRR